MRNMSGTRCNVTQRVGTARKESKRLARAIALGTGVMWHQSRSHAHDSLGWIVDRDSGFPGRLRLPVPLECSSARRIVPTEEPRHAPTATSRRVAVSVSASEAEPVLGAGQPALRELSAAPDAGGAGDRRRRAGASEGL